MPFHSSALRYQLDIIDISLEESMTKQRINDYPLRVCSMTLYRVKLGCVEASQFPTVVDAELTYAGRTMNGVGSFILSPVSCESFQSLR